MVSGKQQQPVQLEATIIPRAEHNISREKISDNALKVLYRLNNAGFQAYLVGGCIRDLLMGVTPKDFDITTNATPEQIKSLFKNCRLIGRRFRLAHILFGRDIIEVATFRGHHDQDNSENISRQSDHGQLLRDNVYGSIEEDAERRDFTVNALYYNIADFSVYDFANGLADINNKRIALIGDAETRYREDPVRMLRAVRFACKLNMQISDETAAPIFQLNELLNNIPPARLFDEVIKLLLSGCGEKTFDMLRQYGLFQKLFPILNHAIEDDDSTEVEFIRAVLQSTDARIAAGKRVTPAYMYASLLWYPMVNFAENLLSESSLSVQDAYSIAANEVLQRQKKSVMIPNHFASVMRDIWQLQHRLNKRHGKQAIRSFTHPRFRAAYDFLLLRSEIEAGELSDLAKWWTEFQQSDEANQQKLISALGKRPGQRRKRQFRKRKPTSND